MSVEQRVNYELNLGGASDAASNLKAVAEGADGATSKMGSLSNQFALGAVKANIMTGAVELAVKALRAYVDLIKESIAAAMGSEVTNAKMTAVFQDQAEIVSASLVRIGESAGYSVETLRDITANLGNFLNSMGMSREEVAGLSTDLVQVAVDMAAFNGIPVEEALQAIRSGFQGMSRPLLQYGIDLRGAKLDQELLEMGIRGGAQAASEAELAQARYNMIIEQTTVANGAAADSLNTVTGMTRAMEGEWNDFKDQLGEELLPVLKELLPFMREELKEILPDIIAVTSDLAKFMTTAVESGADVVEFFGGTANIVKVLRDAFIVLTVAKVADTVASGGLIGATGLLTAAKLALATAASKASVALSGAGGVAGAVAFTSIQIYNLVKAIEEANRAKELEAAAEAEANSFNLEAMGILEDYRRGVVMTNEEIRDHINILNQFGDQAAPEVIAALRLLNNELAINTNYTEGSKLANEDLEAKLGHMSREEILAAVSTNLLTIATLESTEATKYNAAAISGRIQALRDYNEVLKAGLREAGSGGGGGGAGRTSAEPPVDPKEEFRGGAAEQKLQEYLEAEREMRIEAADLLEEALREKREANFEADMAAEEARLQARYDLNMYFANQIVGVFSDTWDGGFDDIGKNFKKMLDKMMKELVMSGVLSAFSSLAGGGTVGLFGKIFGGGK